MINNSQVSSLKSQLSSLSEPPGAYLEERDFMPHEPASDLRERAFRFTCKLFDYCDDLARNPGPSRRLADQLFDAGSSIGANLAESKSAHSRRELAAKNAISLKESHETKYWLRVATAKSLGKPAVREWLLQESDEFVAMLTVSVRRLQTEPDPRSNSQL